jgi:hypothetical protein
MPPVPQSADVLHTLHNRLPGVPPLDVLPPDEVVPPVEDDEEPPPKPTHVSTG